MAYKYKIGQPVLYKRKGGYSPFKATVIEQGDGGYLIEYQKPQWQNDGSIGYKPTREFCFVDQLSAIAPYSDGVDNWD